jgi:hypothetical protein
VSKVEQKPYVIYLAEIIYKNIVDIKKKILIFQILMLLKDLLVQLHIMKLVVVSFMILGLNI